MVNKQSSGVLVHWLVAVVVAGGVCGCSETGAREDPESDPAREQLSLAYPVKTEMVSRLTFSEKVSATGRCEANETARISSKIGGRIGRLLKDEGDLVEAGEKVVLIEDIELKLAVAESEAGLTRTEAELAGARRDLERVRDLGNVAAESQVDDALTRVQVLEANLANQKALLAVAKQLLDDAVIVSPLTGVLYNREHVEGEIVAPGAAIISALEVSPIKIEVNVPEKKLSEVGLGQTAAVTIDALAGRSFEGTVSYISPRLDPVSRDLMVRIMVSNEDMSIKPGMFARVLVSTRIHENAVVVSSDAVRTIEGETVVLKIADNKIDVKPVRLSAQGSDWAEVIEGLEGGEETVVVGRDDLRAGDAVNVVARSERTLSINGNRADEAD